MSDAVVTGAAAAQPGDAVAQPGDAKQQTDGDRNTESNQHESEYDTASDSPSDGEERLDSEDGSEETDSDEDLQSGEDELGGEDDDEAEEEDEEGAEDAAENPDDPEAKKKVDDDEDRSNPQYIPKKGTFYEHDDRTADAPVGKPADEATEASVDSAENASSTVSPLPAKPVPKKPANNRWSHDRFDMCEQAPKSSSELVSAYGYDIRSEDAPPKVKRNKHYGRGPTKYDRNWEDENAYGKQVVAKRVNRSVPKGEDFPRLNERRPKKSSVSREDTNTQDGSEDGGRSYGRNRRQGGEGRRGGGEPSSRYRGGGSNEKTGEFKSRNYPGRSSGGGGGGGSGSRGPGSGRLSHRRGGGDEGGRGHGGSDQPSFNGMSFTNSNLGHHSNNKRMEGRDGPDDGPSRHAGRDDGGEVHAQRIIPKSGGYGSGRLHRRDDNLSSKPHPQPLQGPPQHFQNHSQSNEMGGLPLSVSQQSQQQHQLHGNPDDLMGHGQRQPKRYSEKRQRNEQQQSHSQLGPQVLGTGAGMMDPQLEHLQSVAVTQQQQQQMIGHPDGPQSHLQQGGFMTNTGSAMYVQMEKPQQMMAVQQQQQPPAPQQQQQQQAPQPIPAQYANYYPGEFLPQATPAQQQQTVVANPGQQASAASAVPYQPTYQGSVPAAPNGPPVQPQTQLMNYVPTIQAAPAPQPQAQAQYSQYPAGTYQNYAPLPLQAPSNVAYYAPQPAQSQQPPQPSRAPLPQRRPTNAIPIMAPPDRNPAGGKGRGRLVNDMPGGGGDGGSGEAGVGRKAGDDIDHILDNMFVRRPQQAPQAMTTSASSTGSGGGHADKASMSKAEGSLDEGMKDLRLNAGDNGDGKVVAESSAAAGDT